MSKELEPTSGFTGFALQVGRDILVVKVTFEQRSDKSIRLCGHVEEGHTSGATHVKDTEQCMLEGPTAQQVGQHDQERKHQRTDEQRSQQEEPCSQGERSQDTKPLPHMGLVLRCCFGVTSQVDLLI